MTKRTVSFACPTSIREFDALKGIKYTYEIEGETEEDFQRQIEEKRTEFNNQKKDK